MARASAFCTVLLVLAVTPALAQRPAFPGAEGHGALATGGRGGAVLHVTSLADTGPGTLREALTACPSGQTPACARTVVFDVGGTITLASVIRVTQGNLTVAGQTAPGGGILIRGADVPIRIDSKAGNVILRYLRLRNSSGAPDNYGDDNITIRCGNDVILDHLSVSWATDENVSLWKHNSSTCGELRRITVQRSLIGEGIRGHSMGLIVGGDDAACTDSGSSLPCWQLVRDISIHHNLFHSNNQRNPRTTSKGAEVLNNVASNWGDWIVESSREAVADVVGNYWKPGPMEDHLFGIHEFKSSTQRASIHTSGNLLPGSLDPGEDNWPYQRQYPSLALLDGVHRRASRLAPAAIPVTVQPADQAFTSVLADVGANARLDCDGRWVANPDEVDQRFLDEVRAGNGPSLPPTQSDILYPMIDGGLTCPDTDRDGMFDGWENRYGFNRTDPADRKGDPDGDGYDNLEEFLNGTEPRGTPASCGNGVREGAEACDGADLGGQTCPGGGTLECTSQCTLDTSGCTSCDGDGLCDPGESSTSCPSDCPATGQPVEVRVSTGSDDAEESSTGVVTLSSSDLELVTDAAPQAVGIRFRAVALPRGARITSAWIQFQVDETGSTATALTIHGQAADNPATFAAGSANVSSRPRTAASVAWNPAAWTVVGQAGAAQRTPDLAPIVQEVVSRPGWAPGNALVVVLTGSGRRTAEAFDGSPSGAPLLHVEYGQGGGTCGNGVLDPGESCDGANLGGQTCQGLGHDGGTLGCSATCTVDESACFDSGSGGVCGNNIREPGEACDGRDLDGQTCRSLGFTGGGLASCNSSCGLVTTSCSMQTGRILNVPSQHATIQAAIDAAAAGDTVLVAEGSYAEKLTVNKRIQLVSRYHQDGDEAHIARTILNHGASSPMVTVTSAAHGALIEGFTFTGAIDKGIDIYAQVDLLHNSFHGMGGDCVNYNTGSGGRFAHNVGGRTPGGALSACGDDVIDIDSSPGPAGLAVEKNTLTGRGPSTGASGSDVIEFRLEAQSNPERVFIFRDNVIERAAADGIQLIHYPGVVSNRRFSIQRNVFRNNGAAGIGTTPDRSTSQYGTGAPMANPVLISNNTFLGGRWGVVGGTNMLVLNNVFKGQTAYSLRMVSGQSWIAYDDVYAQDATRNYDSNSAARIGEGMVYLDPLLDASQHLLPGSPAIDAGVARYERNGQILTVPSFRGTAPDMGAFESGGP